MGHVKIIRNSDFMSTDKVLLEHKYTHMFMYGPTTTAELSTCKKICVAWKAYTIYCLFLCRKYLLIHHRILYPTVLYPWWKCSRSIRNRHAEPQPTQKDREAPNQLWSSRDAQYKLFCGGKKCPLFKKMFLKIFFKMHKIYVMYIIYK